MLIRRKQQFHLGIALLVVGLAFLLFPPYGAYCEGDQANNYYCAAYEISMSFGSFVEAHAGAFTALATVAIAYYTFVLKQSTEKNAQALVNAENAFPFVLIAENNVAKIVSSYGRYDKSPTMWGQKIDRPSVAYFLKNYGRTSILLQRISNQIIVAPAFPERPDFSIRVPMPEELIVGPDRPSETLICTMEDKFTVGDAVRFQQQEVAIWFYGYIVFMDAFDERRQIEYRFRYGRGDGGFRLQHYRSAPYTDK